MVVGQHGSWLTHRRHVCRRRRRWERMRGETLSTRRWLSVAGASTAERRRWYARCSALSAYDVTWYEDASALPASWVVGGRYCTQRRQLRLIAHRTVAEWERESASRWDASVCCGGQLSEAETAETAETVDTAETRSAAAVGRCTARPSAHDRKGHRRHSSAGY